MEILFYCSGVIAIISTVCMILNKHPMYALLYLILSLLSISCNLFSLRAPFAGAIEVILYAGAIMVLFVFFVMMLNMNAIVDCNNREYVFLSIKACFGVFLLMGSLLVILLYVILGLRGSYIDVSSTTISIKQIGVTLFGSSYMLLVEMVSFLLLSALISVLHMLHVFRKHKKFNSLSFCSKEEHIL